MYYNLLIRRTRPFLILFVFSILISCSDDDPSLSMEVEDYLEEVLTVMEENSINRNIIDWMDFRNQVFDAAGSSQKISEIDEAIKLALTLLDDNHSFYIKAAGTLLFGERDISCSFEEKEIPSIPSDIGYVKINGFSSNNPSDEVTFAQSIQAEISAQDNADISGWIVDLRENTGGNMWPMLTGIGPILGEGICGYFIDPDNREAPWTYENGVSSNGFPIVAITNPYTLINQNPKVAVLLSNAVTSSGEAIAIAFVGRENARSFGNASCGLSTANAGFVLSDNSTLVLTTSVMADRNKNKFGFQVSPDTESDDQSILLDALDYLRN